ncbi:P-loop containing nucleoside triphosphate hydrolase protein, partial [Blastocladiella britannica]
RVTVGLVGYPNVGKSSTINALCGAKRVSVSATPGKTKHFQTINLTDSVMLCDCPGLVFPRFATTQAEMVCNGVLPIDQLRESTAPSALVAQEIPKDLLERIYGIRVKIYDDVESGRTVPTGDELCKAYALARGFMRQGQGNPDESRAARYLLKDYTRGKLVYVHPPP